MHKLRYSVDNRQRKKLLMVDILERKDRKKGKMSSGELRTFLI